MLCMRKYDRLMSLGQTAATASRAKNFDRWLLGVSYMPDPKVAIKMDWSSYNYQIAEQDDKTRVDLALAWMY